MRLKLEQAAEQMAGSVADGDRLAPNDTKVLRFETLNAPGAPVFRYV
ncbi:hypothetical protein [[Roseibacterium] beibuensis]|nr:hypothetical protein [Roseibacterium beibuensis]